MKVMIDLNRATAGSVYSEPDMGAVEQLLPSDEELAEQESARAVKKRKDEAEEAKKKATAEKEKAEKGPKDVAGSDAAKDAEDASDEDEDSDGDEEDDSEEDESEDDESEDAEGGEEDEATAASFTDAVVDDADSINNEEIAERAAAKLAKKPEDMTPEELEEYLNEKETEDAKPKTDADGNPVSQPAPTSTTEGPTNEIKPANTGTAEKPKTKPLSPALAAALAALDDNLRPTSFS